jgi:hypothetical protein
MSADLTGVPTGLTIMRHILTYISHWPNWPSADARRA